MRGPDTTMGGAGRVFPSTTFALMARLRDADPAERQSLTEAMCREYWKPVYGYLRTAMARTTEDAKDLTQAFFLWLFEGGILSRYQSERGGFRPFLKGLMRNFVAHHEAALNRLKRRGGVRTLSLDLPENLPEPVAPQPADSAESVFDRVWMGEILQRAMDDVRAVMEIDGRLLQFQIFEAYDLVAEGGRPTYAELAARWNLKETDVRNHLFAVRRKIRLQVRSILGNTVEDQDSLEAEWKLFHDV